MPLKLDQRIVKSLQPGDGGRVRVADSVVQGLHIELGLPGKDEVVQKTWRLRYRTTAGDRKWFTIGSWPTISVDKARAEARKLLGAIEGGDDPSSERNKLRQAPTVSVMWEQFLELHGRHLRPTTLKGYQDQYRAHIEPVFGSVRVQDLEREAIARWHHKKSLKAPTSADYPFRENPRLCRGGSRSLTFQGVHLGISNREPPSARKEVRDGLVGKSKPLPLGV
ncbi:integrase arm-type DNA-binding domain-containing protein [Holophaga foetida]|uniref:integrase arm-type DNA-binding domain-containing protein n=1 Tax=Holophaga foetida TaxID=35839 RepID=UPI00130DBBAF|nr:integrase arm-type DNA-binding domain-containing protein [Holophaga foetida]